jgi:hypothetical protein
MIQLFRALTLPPKKTVRGLWAELFIIARASEPRVLLDAWHVLPEDRYDFGLGPARLEVKSSNRSERCHYFSLEQIMPVRGTTVVIASVVVDRLGGGESIGDLIARIAARVNQEPRVLFRLEEVVAGTLGELWRKAVDERFDWQLAEATLRFFRSADIPIISLPIPSAIKEVRLRIDLKDCPPLDLGALLDNPLWRATA